MPSFFNRRRSSCTKLFAQEVIGVMAVPGTSIDGKEASALSMLDRADELDHQRRFAEATVCYEEGLQLLLDVIRASKVESKRNLLREKALKYMDRAEKLKENSKQPPNQSLPPQPPTPSSTSASVTFFEPSETKTSSLRHRVITILADSIGHSYASLFGEYLDHDIITVTVKDPYIRSYHQILNFLRFCELLVKSCRNLRFIKLVTTLELECGKFNKHQRFQLEEIRSTLSLREIQLDVEFSTTLHDREIRLSNGWIIKIGRGLDIYKAADQFTIGFFDFDLRPCYETTVNIYRADEVV